MTVYLLISQTAENVSISKFYYSINHLAHKKAKIIRLSLLLKFGNVLFSSVLYHRRFNLSILKMAAWILGTRGGDYFYYYFILFH